MNISHMIQLGDWCGFISTLTSSHYISVVWVKMSLDVTTFVLQTVSGKECQYPTEEPNQLNTTLINQSVNILIEKLVINQ